MALTPKQEKFAQEVASGKSQADAYRAAYSCEKSKPQTVQQKAYELMKVGDVSARVRELQGQLSAKSLWTREDSVRTLIEVLTDGEVRPNDKIAATKVLNDMHGYNAPIKTEGKDELTIRVID